MIQDLVTFIGARLDEEETTARATAYSFASSIEDSWIVRHMDRRDDMSWAVYSQGKYLKVNELHEADARHIAHHDPASVLADIAARRRLLDHWPDPFGTWGAEQADAARAMKEYALRALAARYASHPEFRVEWRIG